MPLSIFRNRTLSVANVLALLVFGTIFSLFFVLSFYLQQVLNYSALRAGVSYLPIALTLIVAATASSKIVTKTGPMPLLAVGMSLAAIALVLFAQAPVDGDYLTDLLPGFLLGAAGLGMSVVPVQVAAFSGVHESESGLAAGLINTSQEIGGALMVAVVANVSVSKFRSALAERGGDPSQIPAALTEGFHLAFYVGAALAVGAVILAVTLLRKVPAPQEGAVIAG